MRPTQIRNAIAFALLLLLGLWAMSVAAGFIIDYNWWKEVGQVDTWISMLWYSIAPAAAGTVIAFIALWVAHARGLDYAGIRRRDFRLYSGLVSAGLALVAILFASAAIDYWTVMRFVGSRGLTHAARRLEGSGLFARPCRFIFCRFAFLFKQLLGFVFCAGDFVRPGLLGYRSWMAVVGTRRLVADFRSGAARAAAARRQPHQLPAHHRRDSLIGSRPPGFSSAIMISCSAPTPS